MIRTNFIQFIDQPLPPHTWQDQNSIHMISVAGQEESSHSARETGACFIDERTDVCLWADLGTAGSGSGLLSECGWCADRIPGLKGHQDLRFRLNWGDCRGPQHTDCYSSRPHAPDCWYCCWSHCWMTLSPRHLDLALEREDNPCSAFWLGVPGAQSPHLRAVASYFPST